MCSLSVHVIHIHRIRRGLVVQICEYVMSMLSKDEGMERRIVKEEMLSEVHGVFL